METESSVECPAAVGICSSQVLQEVSNERDLLKPSLKLDIPLTKDTITSELNAWTALEKSDFGHEVTQNARNTYNKMMERLDATSELLPDIGETLVTGSHLPRHSDHHRSLLSGTVIQGPVFS
ncbi:WD repeat-containing protein 17-like isoform X2 [Tachypleus tridentatus]|uniref:WD repeat-containing protein 17-like isoform X2 n=1 Tax=Tachypleus tridentatus TaxID=6853 RepID=UPI003FD3C3B1